MPSTYPTNVHHHSCLIRNFSSYGFVLCYTLQVVQSFLKVGAFNIKSIHPTSFLSHICVCLRGYQTGNMLESYRINHFGLPSPFFYIGSHDNFLFWFSFFTALQNPCRFSFCYIHTITSTRLFSYFLFFPLIFTFFLGDPVNPNGF